MEKIVHIEFTKNHGAYSPGDIAGFDPSAAKALIDKGVAVEKQWAGSPAVEAAQADEVSDDSPAVKPARGRRK